MNYQDLGYNSLTQAAPASTTPQASASLGLLDDPTALAIHDAFLIGWDIQELKSKVLLEALSLQQPASASSSSKESGPTSNPPLGKIDMLMKEVLQSTFHTRPQPQEMPFKLNNSISRTSEWRAIFSRIATIHDNCFHGSTTECTLYDPSPASPLQESFPYLYPSTSDYALIGNNSAGNSGSSDFDKDESLGKFKLYDVTRRALNCLNLLYTRPEESLTPDLVGNYQRQLVQALLDASPDAEVPGREAPVVAVQEKGDQNGVPSPRDILNQEAQKLYRGYLDEASVNSSKESLHRTIQLLSLLTLGPSQETKNQPIKFLSFLIVRFLENWDSYLRENYYAGGQLKDNEFELIAYEAGRSMASLSWGISLMLEPLEKALELEDDSAQLESKLAAIWMSAFKDSNINYIQQQISTLSRVFDEAYYRVNGAVQRQGVDELPNPDLPSHIIHAISYSLLYWQRAIERISQGVSADTTVSSTTTQDAVERTTTKSTIDVPPVKTTISTTMMKEEIKTTTTSATLSPSLSNQPAEPPAFTMDLSRQLRQALISQAAIWESLMLCERDLKSFATESVTKRILNNVMVEFEDAARSELLEPTEKRLRRWEGPTIGFAVLMLIILGGAVFLLWQMKELQSLVAVITFLVGSILTLFSTVVTRISSSFSPLSREPSSLSGATRGGTDLYEHLGGLFGLTGGAVFTAFHDAYQQIRIEFDDLNHHVAISYPLIDFFIANASELDEEIKDSYTFLTKIIWTSDEQREEIEQVARAALGPLGAILRPQFNTSSAKKDGSKAPHH